LPIIILGKYAGRVVVLAIHRKARYQRNKGNVDVNIYNGDVQQLKFIPLNNVSVRYVIIFLEKN
jgi:hypothetical protein